MPAYATSKKQRQFWQEHLSTIKGTLIISSSFQKSLQWLGGAAWFYWHLSFPHRFVSKRAFPGPYCFGGPWGPTQTVKEGHPHCFTIQQSLEFCFGPCQPALTSQGRRHSLQQLLPFLFPLSQEDKDDNSYDFFLPCFSWQEHAITCPEFQSLSTAFTNCFWHSEWEKHAKNSNFLISQESGT